ncbi:MAG: YabP/YqfC family sporulation protein [Oscillospiraceae bacterium]|nr:YabP/YqfC family sporulation protein [Oscillospiraceae bacterium]
MTDSASAIKQLARRLDIQEEAVSAAPRIVISGNGRVLVEGHRGLLEYSAERVAAAGAGCRILIKGEKLMLEAMSGRQLVVTGRLWAVEVE